MNIEPDLNEWEVIDSHLALCDDDMAGPEEHLQLQHYPGDRLLRHSTR